MMQHSKQENTGVIDIRKKLVSINERHSLVQKTVSYINSKHSEHHYDVNREGGVSEILEGIQYSIFDISKVRNASTQCVHNQSYIATISVARTRSAFVLDK